MADEQDKFQQLRERAEAGDPVAMRELAFLLSDYDKPEGNNIPRALELYWRCGELGDRDAFFDYGVLLEEQGRPVEQVIAAYRRPGLRRRGSIWRCFTIMGGECRSITGGRSGITGVPPMPAILRQPATSELLIIAERVSARTSIKHFSISALPRKMAMSWRIAVWRKVIISGRGPGRITGKHSSGSGGVTCKAAERKPPTGSALCMQRERESGGICARLSCGVKRRSHREMNRLCFRWR